MKFDPATMYAAAVTPDGRRAATLTFANAIIATAPVEKEDGQYIPNLSASDFQAALDYVAEKGAEVLNLRINCPGGDLNEGLAMYDALRACKMETHGEGFGIVASAATLLLCGCQFRTIGANSTYMVHQPTAAVRGTPEEMESYVAHCKAQRDRAFAIYAEVTGKPIEQVMADHQKAQWYIGQAAVDYGFVQALASAPATGEDGTDEQDDDKPDTTAAEMLISATETLTGTTTATVSGWRALAAKMGLTYFADAAEAKQVTQLQEQVATMTLQLAGKDDTINSLRRELATVSASNAEAIDREVTRRVAEMGIQPDDVPPVDNSVPPAPEMSITRTEFNALSLTDRARVMVAGVHIQD